MIAGTWPEDYGSPIFIRGYEGRTYEDVIQAFHDDAVMLLGEGYEPASTTSRVTGAFFGPSWPRCCSSSSSG